MGILVFKDGEEVNLLNQYDTGNFPSGGLSKGITEEISFKEAMHAINSLKEKLVAQREATLLFGNTKDHSFLGILGNIVQSFNGEYLYPSIEEQAAHLLYFVIKITLLQMETNGLVH